MSICGATWAEDPNLVCLRPCGHRGGHSYDDPPIGYGTGGVIGSEAERRADEYVEMLRRELSDAPDSLLRERYVLDAESPGPCPARTAEPDRHYGVIDRLRDGKHAMLPDATLCWGMTIDRALDCLNELRGGQMAERTSS
jgi:hypothetical protein